MSICLSVASNLRCSNLSLPQAQALLVLPAVDLVFCAGIIKLDWGDIKHHQWAIIVEAIVYFCLTLFDYLDRAKAKDGLDIATFATYDKAIGVLTMFPLFFYCASILLLAHSDVLPLTTSRSYSRLIQISLVAITPLILLFNELGSLLGITYQILDGRIYLGFVDTRADNIAAGLTGTALALLSYFQFVIGVACIFYIVRARSRGHGGGVIVGFTCCGSGLLLGTLETLLGFGHQGFPLALTRKIFRTTARALVISGMLLGTSVDEGFALYPSRGGRGMTERRGSSTGLRAMISNPRSSTFAHLSPRATVFHNNHSASRLGGLARSDSSSSTNHLMADPRRPIENIPPSRSQNPVENIAINRDQDLSRGLVLGVPTPVTDRLLRKQKRRQTDGIYFSYASPSLEAGPSNANNRKIRSGFNPFDPQEMAKLPVRANKPGDRVTIHFPNGDYTKAPVLQLRLSDLKLPSPRAVADGLRTPDGTSLAGNHSHAGQTLEDGSSHGDGYQAAARRKMGLPARPREVSFSDAGSGRTPRENGVRFPSRPISAHLSRRWSSFTGSRGSPGGSWKALGDEHDDTTDLPLEPPQPAFVVREERASTPRSARSRASETESIWLKGSTLPPPAASGERSSQQRSTWYSEDYDVGSPATPKFAAKIVEARAISVRPHWSTAFIYHPQLPSGDDTPEQAGPSSNVPFPIAPSPLNQLANQAKEKEAQFEADFQTGLTRQIYVGERRVSRAPPGSSTEHDDDPYGRNEVTEEEPTLTLRPRLSDRAVDMERRRRSPKRSQSNSDESQDSLRRMSHRFKTLQSAEEAATTAGHSLGSVDEVRSLVRGFGTVVSRRPTVRSNSDERESVTLEHGQAGTPSTSLNTLQQVFGQRYSFDARPTIPESEGEVESIVAGRMPRSDSGIFGRDF
ncbi:hypothetical protein M407DRAFT_28314 [Tulasnella calospora MUT 4182]|uniref:Uncharacterized protein n=1 Tax=Tulasnella calospora MUT 4182 TaxID=1051891 RepID=A0A0C3QAZ1_9AGAM|nr:hypothetical protein M407DRAFT_28314 [Tulasnella calospora MUT 4182]